MDTTLTAEDLWPLAQKLSHDQQRRLAHLLLRAGISDGEAYRLAAPSDGEFTDETDALAWDAEGWDAQG